VAMVRSAREKRGCMASGTGRQFKSKTPFLSGL
jgi:hypothetical protein